MLLVLSASVVSITWGELYTGGWHGVLAAFSFYQPTQKHSYTIDHSMPLFPRTLTEHLSLAKINEPGTSESHGGNSRVSEVTRAYHMGGTEPKEVVLITNNVLVGAPNRHRIVDLEQKSPTNTNLKKSHKANR